MVSGVGPCRPGWPFFFFEGPASARCSFSTVDTAQKAVSELKKMDWFGSKENISQTYENAYFVIISLILSRECISQTLWKMII